MCLCLASRAAVFSFSLFLTRSRAAAAGRIEGCTGVCMCALHIRERSARLGRDWNGAGRVVEHREGVSWNGRKMSRGKWKIGGRSGCGFYLFVRLPFVLDKYCGLWLFGVKMLFALKKGRIKFWPQKARARFEEKKIR